MKLILTADVPNLGAPGDIVEVKDGYGRNFLLPRSLAVLARLGMAVTLAALLVVTGTLLAVLDVEPVPAGVSTAGR